MRKTALILISLLSCVLFTSRAQDAKDKVITETVLIDAVTDYSTGNIESALKKLEYLDEKLPADDAVQYYLGRCYAAKGNLENAEKHIKAACSADTTNLWYQDYLASIYTDQGKNAEAAKIYLSLYKKNPGKYTNEYTLYLLGNEQLYNFQDSLAMESFNKALAMNPDYVPAIMGKCDAYRYQNNIPAFFATVNEIIENPSLQPAAKTEYLDEIIKHIDYNFYRNWGSQLDSLVSTCAKVHPTDSSALKFAGSWYFSTERKEKGKEYFKKLLECYPDDLNAHFIDLQMLYDEGVSMKRIIDKCEEIIRIGGENNPKVLPAMVTIGDSYHTLGQNKNAYKAYERVLKLNPEYLPVLNNYAYYLSLEGKKLKKAEQMSRITVEKDPDNATYLDTYGWILYLRKEYLKAKPYFKHAMLYGGRENSVILEHYSKVLQALGETELAKSFEMLAEAKKAEGK